MDTGRDPRETVVLPAWQEIDELLPGLIEGADLIRLLYREFCRQRFGVPGLQGRTATPLGVERDRTHQPTSLKVQSQSLDDEVNTSCGVLAYYPLLERVGIASPLPHPSSLLPLQYTQELSGRNDPGILDLL